MEEKIILYLTFAKSKLNPKCKQHKKAREEINLILQKIRNEGECI